MSFLLRQVLLLVSIFPPTFNTNFVFSCVPFKVKTGDHANLSLHPEHFYIPHLPETDSYLTKFLPVESVVESFAANQKPIEAFSSKQARRAHLKANVMPTMDQHVLKTFDVDDNTMDFQTDNQ